MGKQCEALKQIDQHFNKVFGGRGEDSVVQSLIRSSAKSIVLTYPDCNDRSKALDAMVTAAKYLKQAEGVHVLIR